jgi:regulatory protein YycH of two-component signal transduction system YycFG
MKFETIKTIILTFLVGGSIFLTWSIWSYKPSYDTIKQDVTNSSISVETKQVQDLIKPNKILLHQNHIHLGTVNSTEIDRIINELQGWHFFDIGTPKTVSESDLRSFIQGNNHMEIDFPNRVPFEVYKGILQINKKQVSNVFFDRIIIDFEKGTQKERNIYFIDTENRKIASSTVSNNEIQAFLNKTKQKETVYQAYEAVQIGSNYDTFLPKRSTTMLNYQYSVKDKDELENFKKALFSDPDSVQKSESKDKIEYINSSSLMRADLTDNMLLYVNPAENADYTSDPSSLLKQSIEFVNDHGGWTDEYRYFDLDNNAHEVDFRLYMDGYPVFNSDRMAEIQQYWGENEIYQYLRPFVSLEVQIFIPSEKSLKPGKMVLKELLDNPNLQKNKLQDLVMGYKLQKDPKNPEILSFEPTWYCLYDGTWSPVSELGGKKNGME